MHKATERPPLIVIYMTEKKLGYDEAYSLKTPLMWGYHIYEYHFRIISYLSSPSPYPFFDICLTLKPNFSKYL